MIVTHKPCGTQWANSERRSHCTECHRTFAGHTVGDAHRVGGRCLTDEEMTERKFVLRERASQGVTWAEWGGQPLPDEALARMKGGSGSGVAQIAEAVRHQRPGSPRLVPGHQT